MNQMERLFRDCHFSFNLPHPNDPSWRINYVDTASYGYITLMRVVDIPHLNMDRAEIATAIRKLNQFANVILRYVETEYGFFDQLAVRKWLENTDWYMVERG